MHAFSCRNKSIPCCCLTAVLIAVAVVLAYPTSAIAQTSPEGYEYEVELGGTVVTGLPGATGKVEIPSSIQGLPVTGIAEGAFECNHAITEVVIPDGVTSIGDRAFNDCTALASITIPGTVTSIGQSAFYSCSSLAQVKLPDGLSTLGDYAFFNCRALTSVAIPGSLESWGTASFSQCSSLVQATICDGIAKVSERAFKDCGKLADVDLSPTVKTIGRRAFESCASLSGIDLSHVVTLEARALASGALGEVDLGSLEVIGEGAFYNQTNLSLTSLPSVRTIETGAFENSFGQQGCATLALPSCLESVAEGAFKSVGKSLVLFEVDPTCTTYKSVDGALYTADGSTLVAVPTGWSAADGTFAVAQGTARIGAYAFSQAGGIRRVTMPDSVTELGRGAFSNAAALATVELSHSLKEIPDEAFSSSGLTSIDIPDSVERIGDKAFHADAEESNLASITFGSGLKSIGRLAFGGCLCITEVELPASLENLDPTAFAQCDSLKSLSFAEGCALSTDGTCVYADNGTKLVCVLGFALADDQMSFAIPKGVTCVGSLAFTTCPLVTSITVPDTVTTFEDQSIGWRYSDIAGAEIKREIAVYGSANNEGLVAYLKKNELGLFTQKPESSYPSATLSVGKKTTFDFTAAPADFVRYASSDNSVAAVDANGTVTAVGGGEADIFACVGFNYFSMHVSVEGQAADNPYASYTQISDSTQADAWGAAEEVYNDGTYPNETSTPGIHIYTGTAWAPINALLEPNGFKAMADALCGAGEYGEYAQAGTNAASELSQYKVHQNVVVYSGCEDDEFILGGTIDLDNITGLVGQTVTFKPITSTSLLSSVATGFSSAKTAGLILEVYVPKDCTQGAFSGTHSASSSEYELTLAPGTKLSVIDAGVRYMYDADGEKTPTRFMKLAIVEDEKPAPDPQPSPEPEPEPTDDSSDTKVKPAANDGNPTPATGDATLPETGLAAVGLALLAMGRRRRYE